MNESHSRTPPFVLLTATVRPNVASHVAIADPRVRLEQYRNSIQSWASAADGNFRLGIVETSGVSREDLLRGLSRSEASRIRFCSYAPEVEDISRGKGAVELAAVSYALAEFEDIEARSTVIKVTGRLVLLNRREIIRPVAVDTLVARATLNRAWVDTRVVVATQAVWIDHLLPARSSIDDDRGIFVERAIAAKVAGPVALGSLTLAQFRERPILSGFSGSTGTRYRAPLQLVRGRLLREVEVRLTGFAAKKQA